MTFFFTRDMYVGKAVATLPLPRMLGATIQQTGACYRPATSILVFVLFPFCCGRFNGNPDFGG